MHKLKTKFYITFIHYIIVLIIIDSLIAFFVYQSSWTTNIKTIIYLVLGDHFIGYHINI